MWFLREQFFPQTLPSIIRPQLPLVLLHFGMLPMIWVLAKLQNCTLSQCSGLWSGSRISCDVETSGAARALQEGSCTTASQGGKADYDTAVLSGMALDHQPRSKPGGEGGLCASSISSWLLLDTIRLQPGKSCNHVCQHSHYQSFCTSTSLKQRPTPHDHSHCCPWEEKHSPNYPA